MSEGRGVAMAILGIVALIAVVGLVLLFSGRLTAKVVAGDPIYGVSKLYVPEFRAEERLEGRLVKGVEYTQEGNIVAEVGGKTAGFRNPANYVCKPGFNEMGTSEFGSMGEPQGCYASGYNTLCCPESGLDIR